MLRVLRLRWLGFGRLSRELARLEPLWALLFAALATAGAGALLLWGTPAHARLVVVATLALILVGHGHRRDRRLLRLMDVPAVPTYAIEYIAAALPVVVLLAVSGLGSYAALLTAVAPALALLPSGQAHRLRERWLGRKGLWVPARSLDMEWRGGLRGSLVMLPLFYLLAYALSGVVAGPLVVLLGLTFLLCGFYGETEGWPLVQAPERSPASFLRWKVGVALAYAAVVAAPVAIIAVARHPDEAWLVGLGLLGGAVILGGSVLAKYAGYTGEARSGALGALVPALLAGGVLVPPAGAFLLWRFWRLARRNLDPYLHAYH